MIVFAIPLRNPAIAKDWQRCQELCRQTIQSALAQTSPNMRVIVACREFDAGPICDSRLIVIRKDFTDPKPDWESQHHDKYMKIRAALVEARRFAPCYVMKLDADDLVSNRLASYVDAQKNRNGYYLSKGYFWKDKSRTVLVVDGFYQACGSSNIIFSRPDDLPLSMQEDPLRFPLLKFGHNITVESFASMGRPLEAIPFPAAIYRRDNGENISTFWKPSGGKSEARANWKFYVGVLLTQRKRRFLTRRRLEEFSIRMNFPHC